MNGGNLGFRVGAASDTGQVRDVNQDSWFDDERLAIVADGMGGHRGGEVASDLAVQVMARVAATGEATTIDQLTQAVEAANQEIRDASAVDPSLSGMGTTLCGAALVGEGASQLVAFVNVGDSRAYQLTADGLVQLTDDHSLVAMLVKEGRITPDEAATHPQRNVVTRALGVADSVNVDTVTLAAETGQRFVLCSDGLFNEVSDEDIAQILRTITHPREAAEMLVQVANGAGGRDNITVLVVDPVDGDELVAVRAERATAAAALADRQAEADADAEITREFDMQSQSDAEGAAGSGDERSESRWRLFGRRRKTT